MVSFIANMDYCSLYYKQLCRLFISTSWVGYIFFSSYGPQYKIIGGIKHLRGAIIFICLQFRNSGPISPSSHPYATSQASCWLFVQANLLLFSGLLEEIDFSTACEFSYCIYFYSKEKDKKLIFGHIQFSSFFFNFIDKMNIHECNMKILQTRLIFVFNFIDKTLGEALAYHAIYLGISTFPIKILYLKKNKIKSSLKTKNKKRFFYLLKKTRVLFFFPDFFDIACY